MALRRKATVKTPARPQAASQKGTSRLGDSTRPVAADRRLTSNKRASRLMMFVGGTVAVALAASLFVAPLQKYFQQDTTLEVQTEQLAQMRAVNAELAQEVDRLQTTAGIQEAAREEVGVQNPGEERITIIDPKHVPTQLPAGWPYDLASKIATTKRSSK